MISVSRLCCPVCWELLNIIWNNSGDETRLVSFPGCHSIIYPVELPEWLPDRIVKQMTRLFQDRLRVELMSMVRASGEDSEESAASTTQRKQHTSHQSESNISVASTNRSNDDTNFNEWPGPVKN